MLKSAQELSAIAGLVPKEAKLRKKWAIDFYVKANSHWDCDWDKEVSAIRHQNAIRQRQIDSKVSIIGGYPTCVRLVLEANLAKAVGFTVGVILLALVATFGFFFQSG